jgi:wobble nucleotide-excising tRNase
MQILSGAEKNADCPFCEQPLSGSPRIDDYRAYFSEEYANLRQSVLEAISSVERENSGVSLAAFERAVTAARDTNIFWGEFTPLEPIAINAAQITEHRIAARDALLHALGAKRMAPLEQRTLSAAELGSIESFNAHAAEIVQLNRRFVAANLAIQEVKRTAATANIQVIENELNRLRAARARYLPPTAGLCEAYLLAKAAKTLTEQRRERAKEALRQYRTAVFPQYQKSVNDYLALFNTGFRIGQVTPRDTVGGPTCTYNVVIDNATVPVTGGTSQVGEPSFRSTLSSGDRNTLALAFFFASIDHDQQLANKIVVIDDPASSLDDHRSLATVQHARRLGERVDQLIVLSHNKAFLCDLYSGIDQTLCTAISIVRGQSGSALAVWDINSDRVSEHDIRHELLLQYLRNGPVNLNNREVASSIRPHLEAFLRVSCPDTFRPGSQLGPFRGLCEQRVGQPNQILSRHYIDELRDLTEYGNRYHHLGTNKAWATEAINDAQLRGYIDRLMAFMSR